MIIHLFHTIWLLNISRIKLYSVATWQIFATLCTQNSIYDGEFDLNIKYAGLFATWPQTWPYHIALHHPPSFKHVAMLLLSAGIKQKTKQKRWQRWKGVGVGKNMWSLLVWPKPESRPLFAFLSLKTAAARLSVVLSVIYKREIAAASNI